MASCIKHSQQLAVRILEVDAISAAAVVDLTAGKLVVASAVPVTTGLEDIHKDGEIRTLQIPRLRVG